MKFRSRCFALTAIVALASSVLTGCSGGGEDGSGKRFLKLGTAPVGGAFNVVGGAIAEVIEEDRPEGMGKLTATATKGTQENIRALDAGELDFAMANAAITYFAVRGQSGWDKAYDVKAVMTLAPNVAMFLTLQNSGIRTIADLQGKKVTIGPAGAGFEYFVGPLLEAHGVSLDSSDPNGLTMQNATQSGAVDLLGDGAIDAAFLGGAVPTSSIQQACSTQDVFFIPFDPQAREQLIAEYKFFEPYTVKAGTYSDLQSDFEGLNVGSMHLITSGAQDEELVYVFTKTLYERREAVVEKHPAGKAINPTNAVKDTGVEFHPGAIRFYKEAGLWQEAAGAESAGEESAKTETSDETK